MTAIGPIIRHERRRAGLSQGDLAKRVGTCKSWVCQIERQQVGLTRKMSERIEAALKLRFVVSVERQ